MKLKKSLIAITAATSVAMGSGVAVAEEAPQNQPSGELSSQESSSGSSNEEGGITGSIDEAMGWNQQAKDKDGNPKFDGAGNPVIEKTTLPTKLKDIAGIFTIIVGAVGGVATLLAALDKIQKHGK